MIGLRPIFVIKLVVIAEMESKKVNGLQLSWTKLQTAGLSQ